MALSNYLPYAGYWFYGAANDTQRAAFYASYGLLDTAPAPEESTIAVIAYYFARMRFE